MKPLFLLSLGFLYFPCFARQTVETNLILTSLPQSTREGIVVQAGGLRVYLEKPPPLALGQQIYVEGRLYAERRALYGESAIIVQETSPFWALVSRLRLEREQAVLRAYGPRAASLILSLVFGNKNFLSPRFTENAKSAGMSHFFALSGLHLALASGAAVLFLSLLGLGRRWVLAAALPLSAAYLLLGGMGLPLQRAFLFHCLWAAGNAARLNLRLSQVFAFSLFLMAFWGAGELSFWLSFAAIGGIIFLRGFWEEICLRFLGSYFGSLVSTSLAAGLATLPLSLYYFGEFNRYFLLSNLLILPFAPLVVLLCLGAALLPFPLWGVDFVYGGLLRVCTFTAHIPQSLVFVENKRTVTACAVLSFLGIYIMIRGAVLWRLKHARLKKNI